VKKQRESVEKNYLLNQGKVKYVSFDATTHLSFDWAENVLLPHFDQQPSWIYHASPPKVHLFGVHNEATGEQINFVLDESELLNKGVNGTLSMVLAAIRKLNRGEKHLKLNCDNCAGQNKNNTTIRTLLLLIFGGCYDTIELHFMIAGHTKFSPDRSFGMIKKLYNKSTIYTKEQFVEVVKNSSPKGLNQVQCYENGKGFRYTNFKVLEKYFEKLPKIRKYHHFLFSANNLGIVKVKEFVDDSWIEINLWKDKSRIMENIKEIRELVFPVLTPKPLPKERQDYLDKNFPSLVKKEFQDITCPQPTIDREIAP
jgi:hypothetical protein